MIINQDHAQTLVRLLPPDPIEQLYYIDSDETDDHPEHTNSFCRKHADMVAKIASITTGCAMHIAAAWAGDDRAVRCDWYGCDIALDGGGLTNYGIDDALGLTETDPDACHVYPAELRLAYQSMAYADARWAQWVRHAERLIKKSKRKR